MAFPVDAAVKLLSCFVVLFICYLCYSVGVAIYNLYFHRLSGFPGPASRAAFYFPEFYHIFIGDSHVATKELHEKYGEVVRIVPDGLTFTSAAAWQDIYGVRPDKSQLEKDPDFFVDAPTDVASIIHSSDADHERIRKLVSYAFSGTALREHEPLMKHYFDLLITKLHSQIRGPNRGRIDATQWFNFTAFDIISRLTLDDCFDLLEHEKFNFWTEQVFQGIKLLRYLRVLRRYPPLWWAFDSIFKMFPKLQGRRNAHMDFAIGKAEERIKRGSEIKDFMSYITKPSTEKSTSMTHDEITLTAAVILIAGSETSATVLSGAAYNLARNPSAQRKAAAEVRAAFVSDKDISLLSLARLPYLSAVIQESLRCFPAVPGTFPRRTGKEGDWIAGRKVPADISVGVHQWSTYTSPTNFHNPHVYAPERWLPDPPEEYKNDNLACLQPFHVGPRNCVGKNLAFYTIRSILARMLWHFEWTLCEESVGWHEQGSFILWDKPPLWLRLVERGEGGDNGADGGVDDGADDGANE